MNTDIVQRIFDQVDAVLATVFMLSSLAMAGLIGYLIDLINALNDVVASPLGFDVTWALLVSLAVLVGAMATNEVDPRDIDGVGRGVGFVTLLVTLSMGFSAEVSGAITGSLVLGLGYVMLVSSTFGTVAYK